MSVASELAAGLRARGAAARAAAARRLVQYVRSELRELPPQEVAEFLDEFNHQILEMVSASDFNDKKAGALAIVCLISGDCDTTKARITRYASYLRNLFPSPDVSVMELAAKTVGRLATISGAKRAEYVEFEVKRAFEWLSVERNEGKRHAAVLILRELAVAMPTYFHQQVSGFFDHIFIAMKDPKPLIREAGSKALQAGLVVTAQRESAKQTHKPPWYKTCYAEAKGCFEDQGIKEKGVSRDDRLHGGLLILNELLRCSHAAWERRYTNLMQTLDTQQEISLTEDIIPLMPRIRSPMNSRAGHLDVIGNSSTVSSQPVTIYESAVCRQLITEKYDTICPVILGSRHSRSPHVQQILMIIIPRLAAFNREEFIKNHLTTTLRHLLATLRGREKDRNMAFTTIGLIAIAIEKEITPWVMYIMEIIKMALPSNDTPSKKRIGMDPAIFVCISLLANAVNEDISSDVKTMLDQMMATGLSPALTVCLRELAQSIPTVKKDISEALLNMLSRVLMNKPLSHPGIPKNLEQISNSSVAIESQDVSSIVLALRTLGSFDFEGHSLLPFVKYCANNFLQSEQQEIRLEAVRTCSRLLAISIQSDLTRQSNMVKSTVAHVLSKLLVVGITDTDCDVRYWVLASLDETFDSYLAQIENLSSLFIAMNDEVLEIRELAICTIGRLSTVNPAYVIPSLRKTLIQFLTELEHSGMSRNKEQSARMLDHLIVSAPRLIRPYMEPILNVLVPKLKESDSNPGVVLSVLRAIGDLAEVNGDSNGLNKWMPELLSILLDLLADASSPEKRNVALWAFGQLISATGQVVTPYSQFPNLMDVLINFLKTEQQPVIRRETIRVLGLLGALDPYKHKISRDLIDGQVDSNLSSADSKAEENNLNMKTNELLINMSSTALEEYYPAIAIYTLMKIIRDPNLSQHHTSVVQAVTFIFQSLGIRCVPYISQVMPSLLYVVRMADMNFRDFLFTQLATLIAIVKQHIRNYLDKIFDLIKEFWTPNSPLQTTLILLVEHVAIALGAEFKIYLPQLIPQILRVLFHDSSKDRAVTIKLLLALQKFDDNLDDYLHLILPPIVRLFDANDCPIAVSKVAMETVDHLADSLDFTDLTSRIVHPLVRSLETCPELRPTAMNTLCALVVQLGRKFNHFIPLVQKVINKHKIPCQRYEVLICKLQSNTTLAGDEDFLITRHWFARHNNQEMGLTSSDNTTIKKLQVNAINLRLSWTAARRVSKDDWLEWLRNLSIGLLKESQSPALRSCLALAQNYSQLLRDLFNAAFVSCWTELKEEMQTELVQALEQALTMPDIPEITQTILNLAEFMEHCDRGTLPIQTLLLGERAMHCRAYAKALHYKEEEFRRNVNSQAVEALILINNKLQQREAAEGLLEYVMARRAAGYTDLQVQVRWYEKLHNWEKALNLYFEELQEVPDDIEARLGQMRCLEALGEWNELHRLAGEHWGDFSGDDKGRAGRLAAAAAWGLGDWDSMQHYVQCIPSDSQDGAFYRAVLAVHAGQFSQAQQLVEQTRDLLDTELTAMAGESYQRAYGAMVWVQMLAELEEVVQYKLVPERRPAIRSMWWARLQGGQKLVEDWQRIIRVHRLVISPRDDMHTWLKYASLCRKNGSLTLAHKTLVMLLGADPSDQPDVPLPYEHPQVTFAYCKLLWVEGSKDFALCQLQQFVDSYQADALDDPDRRRLLARCYLKLGAWREALQGITETSIPIVLKCYSSATDHASDWYKAWHAWAYMNFETVLFYKHKNGDGGTNIPGGSVSENSKVSAQYVSKFTVPAVEGFFKSINLSHGSSLQDTLRLLTLWFDYGQWPEVHEAIVEGIRTIEINTWLQVIPQLIARIDTPRALGRLIHSLLIDIGKSHPQALVYPLSVASKSSFVARRNAANQILKSMRTHSANLVEQAMMASEELIRVAILWHEQWHEGLEEASRLYFGEENIKGMLDTLEPLHAMLERGPETLKETSFNQAYGRELMEAQDWCKRYKVSRKVGDLNQAWDLYYHVFRRISRQLPQLTSLELQYVSPKLLNCTNMELAVPGTYRPGQEIVRIANIQSNLQVITSKQRPRRLCIRGSNGRDYMFLLKGHEDLRQDERVMQLFGLANTLLQNDPDTFRRNLTIQRYSVIPLSTNSGLIGWVPHCDTLHTLIRDYRERKKCLLNIEHRLMLRMTVDYDKLMLMQKVEVFEHALEHTQGDDLSKLLWLKSYSSELWFERRTNYTRSLAVMSMVGYILGLGDRHPSNLMLDRVTGKILHIDFGDCFEVAVTRDKFPEKIPFRLTRMLINAMEVTGIEGTYRRTCESVMTVLHKNKDSLMAVLEAFVHDPLLNWRLMDTTKRSRDGSFGTGNSAGESTSLSVPAPLPRRAIPGPEGQPEALNNKALSIINRVRDKLTGRDFNPDESLPVAKQVDLLIQQATSNENLCQCYIGWCPFW